MFRTAGHFVPPRLARLRGRLSGNHRSSRTPHFAVRGRPTHMLDMDRGGKRCRGRCLA